MMERSSRFISLSGLSGIFAGVFALLGAGAAYWFLDLNSEGREPYPYFLDKRGFLKFFLLDAACVSVSAIAAGVFFTIRQAKKKGQKVWDATSRRLLVNLAIPLAAGGAFCLALLYHEVVGLIAPATLVFYGLALLNASKYTLEDVRTLAYAEVVLGVIASFYIQGGLFFWAMGFGVLHIVYGVVMYFKYEK
jgi:hypothetical protein